MTLLAFATRLGSICRRRGNGRRLDQKAVVGALSVGQTRTYRGFDFTRRWLVLASSFAGCERERKPPCYAAAANRIVRLDGADRRHGSRLLDSQLRHTVKYLAPWRHSGDRDLCALDVDPGFFQGVPRHSFWDARIASLADPGAA